MNASEDRLAVKKRQALEEIAAADLRGWTQIRINLIEN
jgi:hypothetical protein